MFRARTLLPVLLCACAVLAAACGGSETEATKFIAKSKAAKLQTTLDAVEQDVAADRCEQAASGVMRMREQVAGFPPVYDTGLVANVSQWIDLIEERLKVDCGEPQSTPTTTPEETPTETATPTETETAEPSPTPDDEPEETPQATPTSEPDVPEPDQTPAPPDDGSGGTGGAPGEDGQ